jgi:hypothetical protein
MVKWFMVSLNLLFLMNPKKEFVKRVTILNSVEKMDYTFKGVVSSPWAEKRLK